MNFLVQPEASPESESLGIKRLAVEVITLALKEVRPKRKTTSVLQPNDHDAHDARCFLTHTSGGWAQSRAYWCALADFDPDAVRDRVLQMLSN